MLYSIYGDTIEKAYNINGSLIEKAYNIHEDEIELSSSAYITGIYYPISEMEIEDASKISEETNEHTRNSEKTILLTCNGGSSTIKINCDIDIGDQNVGLWIWTDRLTKGGYDVANYSHECAMQIKIGNTTKAFKGKSKGASLKSGMNYYYFSRNEVGSDSVQSIEITISGASGGVFYLDSVEVGFKMETPFVLLNLDSSGKNFYPVGYPLFKSYGLTCTFDYNLRTDIAEIGEQSMAFDDGTFTKEMHDEMVNDGFDYGTYSGWYEIEGTKPGAYDDPSDYEIYKHHADLMFHLNNSIGIYAPSTVHANAFKTGEVYQKAMCDAGFLIFRSDAVYLTRLTYMNEFVYFDPVDYREITPYYLGNCWDANDIQIQNAKSLISHCVRSGTNCMIMMHSIMKKGYDHSSNTLDVGYDAIEELLKSIKSYVDAGSLKCATTKEFIKEVASELYSTWEIERNKSTLNN